MVTIDKRLCEMRGSTLQLGGLATPACGGLYIWYRGT